MDLVCICLHTSVLKPKEDHSIIFYLISVFNIAPEEIMNLPTLVVQSRTKKSESSEEDEVYCFQPSEKTASTSTVDDTIKITLVNKRKIMNKSKHYLKNQKIGPKKKRMQSIITILKQDLKRNKKTIRLQQNLLTGIVQVINLSHRIQTYSNIILILQFFIQQM